MAGSEISLRNKHLARDISETKEVMESWWIHCRTWWLPTIGTIQIQKDTPPKFNMEPKNTLIAKKNHPSTCIFEFKIFIFQGVNSGIAAIPDSRVCLYMVVWLWGKSPCFRFKISHWSPTPNSKNQTRQPAAFQDPQHKGTWYFFAHVTSIYGRLLDLPTTKLPSNEQTKWPNERVHYQTTKDSSPSKNPSINRNSNIIFTHPDLFEFCLFSQKNHHQSSRLVFFPTFLREFSSRLFMSGILKASKVASSGPKCKSRALPRPVGVANVGILGSKTGKGGVTWMSRCKLGSMVDEWVITYL